MTAAEHVSPHAKTLVNQMVRERAVAAHVEPLRDSVRIRFRVDGRLICIRCMAPDEGQQLVDETKLLVGVDINETRRDATAKSLWGVLRPQACDM